MFFFSRSPFFIFLNHGFSFLFYECIFFKISEDIMALLTHQSSYFLSFGLFAAEGFPSNVLSSLVNCSGRMKFPPPRGKKRTK